MRRALVVLAALLLGAPVARAQDDQRARGELVFNLGGCAGCHTARGGAPLAGGDPLRTPFGIFYAPNITPDPTHGIGGWTEAQFSAALREGRGPDGSPYYPAFPYTSYTGLIDEDVRALKAYLDAVPPSPQPSRPHELGFPYDQRWGLHLWQLAFFTPGRFAPDPARDAALNRGAYLMSAVGHCAECHTPRNFAGALDDELAYAGGPAPAGEGRIPNISGDDDAGLGDWGEGDVANFLTLGIKPDGDFVGGEMAKVVENGTAKLPPAEAEAIVKHLKSLPPRR